MKYLAEILAYSLMFTGVAVAAGEAIRRVRMAVRSRR